MKPGERRRRGLDLPPPPLRWAPAPCLYCEKPTTARVWMLDPQPVCNKCRAEYVPSFPRAVRPERPSEVKP